MKSAEFFLNYGLKLPHRCNSTIEIVYFILSGLWQFEFFPPQRKCFILAMFSNLHVQNCLKYSPIFLLMSAGNCFINDSGNFCFQFFFVSFVKHLLILLTFPPKNPSALCFIHILVHLLISISLISAYLYFFLSLFALFCFLFFYVFKVEV